MTDDAMRVLFSRYVTALNEGDADAMADLVADEVHHNGDLMSRDSWWSERVRANIDAAPDLHWGVDDLIVVGDRIAVRYTDTATPTDTFAGVAASGAWIRFPEYVFYRVVDERIVETWSLVDIAAIRDQLRG